MRHPLRYPFRQVRVIESRSVRRAKEALEVASHMVSNSKKERDTEEIVDSEGNDLLAEYTNSEGAESEEDVGAVDASILGKAVVTGTDWTAETILSQLGKGNITLDPAFQRRDAWAQSRKAKFIESIILGLPIPQLVLAESQETKGTFLVIDGKQRLLSLQQFAGLKLPLDQEPLVLKGLLVRTELEGKTYSDLQSDPKLGRFLSAFENQSIRTVIVRNWQSEKVLYTIFHRLNTSSVPLSPQELRQALHPGKFLKFAVAYSEESPGLKRTLNLNKPDFRMRDVELLVRYYAYRNFITDYSGSLKEFLDDTCKTLNGQWKKKESEIREQAHQLERAISATFKIFGSGQAFRKWDGQTFERRFNRAAFDIMVYYFSHHSARKQAVESRHEVKKAFQVLCEGDNAFLRSLETSTKSIQSNSIRFSRWGRSLKKLGVPIQIPRIKLARSKR